MVLYFLTKKIIVYCQICHVCKGVIILLILWGGYHDCYMCEGVIMFTKRLRGLSCLLHVWGGYHVY